MVRGKANRIFASARFGFVSIGLLVALRTDLDRIWIRDMRFHV